MLAQPVARNSGRLALLGQRPRRRPGRRAGIATDHCVVATRSTPSRPGSTRVLLRLCAGVLPETTAAAVEQMRDAGVELV
jgi:hypothetical protein